MVRPGGDDLLSKGKQRQDDRRSTSVPRSRTTSPHTAFSTGEGLEYSLAFIPTTNSPPRDLEPPPHDLIQDAFPACPHLTEHPLLPF